MTIVKNFGEMKKPSPQGEGQIADKVPNKALVFHGSFVLLCSHVERSWSAAAGVGTGDDRVAGSA
jgi:hypothetical protein